MPIRLIVSAIVVAVLGLGAWHVNSVFDERDALVVERDNVKTELADKVKLVKQLEDAAIADAAIRQQYLTTLKDLTDETNKLKSCVADKSCGFTVRVRTQTVCSSPGSPDSARIITGSTELAPDAERAYFRHREEIDKTEALLTLCVSTLKDWRDGRR